MKDQYNNVPLLTVEMFMLDFQISIFRVYDVSDQLFLYLIKPCLIKCNLKTVADAVAVGSPKTQYFSIPFLASAV